MAVEWTERRAPADRRRLLAVALAGVAGLMLGGALALVAVAQPRWLWPAAALAIVALLAIISGELRRPLLAVVLLDIPLQISGRLASHGAVALQIAAIGGIFGYMLSASTAAIAALYGLWFCRLCLRRERLPRGRAVAALLPAPYLAALLISLASARSVQAGLFEIVLLAQIALVYGYIVLTVRERRDVLFIVAVLLIGMIAESLLMIVVRVGHRNITFAGISTVSDVDRYAPGTFSRIAGTLDTPNVAGAYLSLLLAPALSLLLARLNAGYKALGALAFGLGSAALVLTLSRGAWVAFGVSLALLLLGAVRRRWISPLVPLFGLLVAGLLAALFQGLVLARLTGSDDGAAAARLPLMRLAWQIIASRPLLGVGANNFAIVLPSFLTPEFDGIWVWIVHNKYLLVWAETGLLGLAGFLLLLGGALRYGWRASRQPDRVLAPLALGCTAAVAGHMTHLLVDYLNKRATIQLLWVMAALLAAMFFISRSGEAEERGATKRTDVWR